MVNLLEYWREISATIGGITIFIFGRKSAKILEKKQQAEAMDIMQKTYSTFLEQYDKQYNTLIKRSEEQASQLNTLQQHFQELYINYTKEVEISQNWEKVHRELEKQYRALEIKYDALVQQNKILERQHKDSDKKHEELQKLYEKLKADFDKHKKQVKNENN